MAKFAMILAAVLVASTASAQGMQQGTQQQQQMKQQTGQTMTVEDVARDLFQGSQMEIEMAKMAQQNSQNQQVQQFARTLIQDHQQLTQQLKTAAQQANVNLKKQATGKTEKAMEQQAKATRDVLQQLQGERFDRAFLTTMLMKHDMSLWKLQQATQGQPKPNQKQLHQTLTQVMPTIGQHRQQAYQMLGTMAPQVAAGTGRMMPMGEGTERTAQPGESEPGQMEIEMEDEPAEPMR